MPTPRALSLTRLGWGLAVPVAFLCSVGLISIHATNRTANVSATQQVEQRVDSSVLHSAYDAIGPLTARQAIHIATGIALMIAVLALGYQRTGRWAYLIYAILIVLLALLVLDRYFDLPLIPQRRNVRRWIAWGPISIQPSEFMKLALILALARYLRFRDSYRTWRGLIPPFVLTLLPMILILKQPDLGTLLMLLPVLFAMLLVAGARMRHLVVVVLLGAATLPAFYFLGMKPYQRERIEVLFKQNTPDESWHMDAGYQLRQGLIAMGTGGLLGQEYGKGVFVRYKLLPEEHNDFVFALIGHQWGLVGCLAIILAYGVIVICGLEIAMVTNDPFGRLLAVGIVVMIVMQALLNMAMNVGLAPITGMTLPFVSVGGSSLWANFLALGMLVDVAKRRPMLIAHPPFEHHGDEGPHVPAASQHTEIVRRGGG